MAWTVSTVSIVSIVSSSSSSSSYTCLKWFVQSHVESKKKMMNLLVEGFNCGRIWALVILSVLRTNDLTWLAFFHTNAITLPLASIEWIEFRLEIEIYKKCCSHAICAHQCEAWTKFQACRCLWKARFCSSLHSFQHNMLKLLTVSQCLLWHRLFNWKADWFHLVHHAMLLQSFSQLNMSSIDVLWVWVTHLQLSSRTKVQNAMTLGRGTQALKLDNLARHPIQKAS